MGNAKVLLFVGALVLSSGSGLAGEADPTPEQPQIGSDLWLDLFDGFHLTEPVYRPKVDSIALCLAPEKRIPAGDGSDDKCQTEPKVVEANEKATAAAK